MSKQMSKSAIAVMDFSYGCKEDTEYTNTRELYVTM